MATVPSIIFSKTGIDNPPRIVPESTHSSLFSAYDNVARSAGNIGRVAGTLIDEYVEKQDKDRKERARIRAAEAEEEERALKLGQKAKEDNDRLEAGSALAKADAFIRSRWDGREEVDSITGKSSYIPGVSGWSIQDWAQRESNPFSEMHKIEKDMRKSDWYKALTSDQKILFEKQYEKSSATRQSAVNSLAMKIESERRKENLKAIVDSNNRVVKDSYGLPPAEFSAVAQGQALKNYVAENQSLIDNYDEKEGFDGIGWNFADSVLPEARAAFVGIRRNEYNKIVAENVAGYIDAMTTSAAELDSSRGISPGESLARAEAISNMAKNAGIFDSDTEEKARKQIAKAKKIMEKRVAEVQDERSAELERGLLEKQFSMAKNGAGSVELDRDDFTKELDALVKSKAIRIDNATELVKRFELLEKAKAEYADAMKKAEEDKKNSERFNFPSKSDDVFVAKLKQDILNATVEDGDWAYVKESPESLLAKLERYRQDGKLNETDYSSMWKQIFGQRKSRDFRIEKQVMSEFFGIQPGQYELAIDSDKRGLSKQVDSAVEELLGNAPKYERDGWFVSRSFSIDDFDAMVRYAKNYAAEHPGDEQGLRKAIQDIVAPRKEAARALAIRDRFLRIFSRQAVLRGMNNSLDDKKQDVPWTIDEAFDK